MSICMSSTALRISVDCREYAPLPPQLLCSDHGAVSRIRSLAQRAPPTTDSLMQIRLQMG